MQNVNVYVKRKFIYHSLVKKF